MLPDRVSNPGPLTYESGAIPIALRGPARKACIFCMLHRFLLCPRDDSQGGGIKFCPCLSVRLFVTLYGIEFV